MPRINYYSCYVVDCFRIAILFSVSQLTCQLYRRLLRATHPAGSLLEVLTVTCARVLQASIHTSKRVTLCDTAGVYMKGVINGIFHIIPDFSCSSPAKDIFTKQCEVIVCSCLQAACLDIQDDCKY